MRISVLDPPESGMAELAPWRALQEASPSLDNPFLLPELTATVAGFRSRVRVAVPEEEPDIVGFSPFEDHTLGIGSTSSTIQRRRSRVTRLVWWFPAYDTAFARFSRAHSAPRDGREGRRVGDPAHRPGRGEEEYKDELKTGEFHVPQGRVVQPRVVAGKHWVVRAPVRPGGWMGAAPSPTSNAESRTSVCEGGCGRTHGAQAARRVPGRGKLSQ
jgi:hypothetical protein